MAALHFMLDMLVEPSTPYNHCYADEKSEKRRNLIVKKIGLSSVTPRNLLLDVLYVY